MRPQLNVEDKLKGHCYLRLQDGEDRLSITLDLRLKNFSEVQINEALDRADAALKENFRFKNIALLKTLCGAAAVFAFGLFLYSHSETAPGRFQGLHVKVYLLAIAIAAYGFWARAQKV